LRLDPHHPQKCPCNPAKRGHGFRTDFPRTPRSYQHSRETRSRAAEKRTAPFCIRRATRKKRETNYLSDGAQPRVIPGAIGRRAGSSPAGMNRCGAAQAPTIRRRSSKAGQLAADDARRQRLECRRESGERVGRQCPGPLASDPAGRKGIVSSAGVGVVIAEHSRAY